MYILYLYIYIIYIYIILYMYHYPSPSSRDFHSPKLPPPAPQRPSARSGSNLSFRGEFAVVCASPMKLSRFSCRATPRNGQHEGVP